MLVNKGFVIDFETMGSMFNDKELTYCISTEIEILILSVCIFWHFTIFALNSFRFVHDKAFSNGKLKYFCQILTKFLVQYILS